MNNATRPARSRRLVVLVGYVLVWLIASAAIGVPVLRGLGAILEAMSPGMRLVFYAMPPLLAGMLVLGALQIISMYRYWFGGSSSRNQG